MAMNAKEVKNTLKLARDSIKNKKFDEATHHCKAILAQDDKNYNAMVFLAVASEEQGELNEGLAAYKSATEIEPNSLLAWQGLSRFYEKSKLPVHKQALILVYAKLIELQQKDDDKNLLLTRKMADVQKALEKYEDCIVSYGQVLTLCSPESDDYVQALATVSDILDHNAELGKKYSQIRKGYLQKLIMSDSLEPADKLVYWCRQVELLYKDFSSITELKMTCKTMHNLYPASCLPVRILCQQILDQNCLDNTWDIHSEELISKYIDMSEADELISVCKAYQAMHRQHYREAIELFHKGLVRFPRILSGWIGAAQCAMKMHDHVEAERAIEQGHKLLQSKDLHWFGANDLADTLELWKSDCYIDSKQLEKLSLAKDILNQKDDSLATVLTRKVLTLMALGELDAADELLKKLETMGNNDTISHTIMCMRGWLCYLRGDLEDAEKYLLDNTMYHNNGIYWLSMVYYGKCAADKCYIERLFDTLIQSVKEDTFDSARILQLGHFYKTYKLDNIKARRCYQRAFDLDRSSEDAGTNLVDLLSHLEEYDVVLQTLTLVTEQPRTASCKWAWLRLGLYHIRTGEYTAAITALQATLRYDLNDRQCWECLGEAYKGRGSHLAALKAFTKALQLDENSVYCMYQIANIQQTLSMFPEAIEGYSKILTSDENYVPALKGLGETYLLLAKSSMRQCFYGLSISHCQSAMHHLSKAVRFRSDLTCLWKLLGDSCTILHSLDDDELKLSVPVYLLKVSEDKKEEFVTLSKLEMLDLGSRCYAMALQHRPECSAYFYDLGVNYFYQSQIMEKVNCKPFAAKSVQALQKALSLNSTDRQYWSTLGVITASPQANNPALAQHCFIKSIQIEENVVAWTNLATLYLKNSNVDLAYKAFKAAQSLDPTYVQAWIGQSLIAEVVGSTEAMDLFRHTTELGYHLEGSIGYAHWVCKTLKEGLHMDKELFKYSIEQMSAIPAASDALIKYTAANKTNATAYNMLGLLLERQRLYRPACYALQQCVQLLASPGEANKMTDVLCNLARCQCEAHMYVESIATYQGISESLTYHDMCWRALAMYKNQQYDEAIQCYTQALEMCTTDADKAIIYAALGATYFALRNVEQAKTYLFQCSQSSSPCVLGLEMLCSLGLIHKDFALTSAVLQELNNMETITDNTHKFNAVYKCLTEDSGVSYLVEKLSEFHEKNDFYRCMNLMTVLLQMCKLDSDVVSTCYSMMSVIRKQPLSQVDSIVKCTVSLLHGQQGRNNAFNVAQKAVHLYPENQANWYLLLAATHVQVIERNDNSLLNKAIHLATKLLAQAERDMSMKHHTSYDQRSVHLWTVKIYLILMIRDQQNDKAKEFIKQALWLYEEDQTLLAIDLLLDDNIKKLTEHVERNNQHYLWQVLFNYLERKVVTENMIQVYEKAHDVNRESPFADVFLCQKAHIAYQKLQQVDCDTDLWLGIFQSCNEAISPHRRGLLDLMHGIIQMNAKNYDDAVDSFDQFLSTAHIDSVSDGVHLAKCCLMFIYKKMDKQTSVQKLTEDAQQMNDVKLLQSFRKLKKTKNLNFQNVAMLV